MARITKYEKMGADSYTRSHGPTPMADLIQANLSLLTSCHPFPMLEDPGSATQTYLVLL